VQPVKVTILGKDYFIRNNQNEEQIKIIAEYINNKFKEIKENAKGLSEDKIAILLAFNIAGDYLNLLDYHEELIRSISRRTESLKKQINEAVL
jgi:cell division protein ZapA (FtsZ GTPase activity inhibitor)